MPAHDPHTGAGPPPVRVRVVGGAGEARTFTRVFRIGRDEACDVEVAHGKVSRVHVEVAFEDGRWWARDAGSSNGTFRDGVRVERVALDGPLHLQLGVGGPEVSFDVVAHAAAREGTRPGRAPSLTPRPAVDRPPKGSGAVGVGAPADGAAGAEDDPPRDPSLTYFIRHYAGGADAGPAGERTMMVREAFRHVQHKQRVRYSGLIAAAVVVALGALGYGAFRAIEHTAARARIAAQDATIQQQEARLAVLQRQARTIFYMLKQRELQASLASATGAPRTEAEREAVRVAEATYVQYERFVDSLGVYDSLSAEDRIIYRMRRP